MRFRAVSLGSLLLACVLAAARPAGAAEPPPAEETADAKTLEARRHFKNGVKLYQDANYAGALAESRRLRGYDAVHLAAALRAQDPDLVLVAGDRALLDAAAAEGLATASLC